LKCGTSSTGILSVTEYSERDGLALDPGPLCNERTYAAIGHPTELHHGTARRDKVAPGGLWIELTLIAEQMTVDEGDDDRIERIPVRAEQRVRRLEFLAPLPVQDSPDEKDDHKDQNDHRYALANHTSSEGCGQRVKHLSPHRRNGAVRRGRARHDALAFAASRFTWLAGTYQLQLTLLGIVVMATSARECSEADETSTEDRTDRAAQCLRGDQGGS